MTTVRNRTAARCWHVATAVVVGAAVLVQLGLSVSGVTVLTPEAPPPVGVRIWRFFSYFTIESNLLVVAGAIGLAVDPLRDGPAWRVLRLAGLIGITVTGLVYATLLAPLVSLQGLAWWLDLILHTISPILVVLGWVIWGPRPRISRTTVVGALLWPLVWLAYTLIVGAASGWFPYPFLDPRRSGTASVVLACIGITVLFLLLATAYRAADRRWPSADRGLAR